MHPSQSFQLSNGPMSLTFLTPSVDGKRLFADGYQPRTELVRYETKSRQFVPFLSELSAGEISFSADGHWIAYVSYPDSSLWRSRTDGSERLQLTSPPVVAFLPRWSPDGRQIAFADHQAGRPWKVLTISADGGTPQEILSEKENQNDVGWSPDGKQLVFGRAPFLKGTNDTIVIKIVDLSTKRESTVPGSNNLWAPRWSPDGRHLAAVSLDSRKLLLFDFETQKWADWVSNSAFVGYPIWSQDGSYVYYNGGSGDGGYYCRVKMGTSKPEQLFSFSGLHFYSFMIGMAPDGSPLVSRDMSSDEIYSLDVDLP